MHKWTCLVETRALWEKRLAFVELKKQFPSLGALGEEELLFDKERVPKNPRRTDTRYAYPSLVEVQFVDTLRLSGQILRIKNRGSGETSSSPAPAEPTVKPKDRAQLIASIAEDYLKKQRERDHHWDNQLNVSRCHSVLYFYADPDVYLTASTPATAIVYH